MNNEKQKSVLQDHIESNQRWREPFCELLDQIYFEGYSKKLAKENPFAFKLEFSSFLRIYDLDSNG